MKKLAHYISSSNTTSRRKAEQYIQDGRVRVNGQIITNVATRVNHTDIITLDNKPININIQPQIWLYYKPLKTLTSHVSEDNKITIFELVHERLGYVLSVGRLDYMSEGLILLTNSNDLAHDLMNGSYKRTYKVLLDHIPANLDIIQDNFTLNNIQYKAWKILNIHDNWLTVTLYEGKNREIRKVFNALGVNVIRLIRVQYGPYKVQGGPNDLFEGNLSLLENYKK